MTKAVNLFLASGVIDGIGFWLIDFTDEEEILNYGDSKLLECYRKELVGITAAIKIKEAINNTLDILVNESNIKLYKIDNLSNTYSSEIPLNIIEDIFDLWADNYNNDTTWKKYTGLLNFRSKIKRPNNFINLGLKGNTLKFAIKLDQLLSFRPVNESFELEIANELMW